MSIRTTATLDEDVLVGASEFARQRGIPFRQALNDLVRRGLRSERPEQPPFHVEPQHMGYRPRLNYDDASELLDHLEGPVHR